MSAYWFLYRLFPRIMMRPSWYMLWVEIKWALTPPRFRPRMPEDFDPFERMEEPEVATREIP